MSGLLGGEAYAIRSAVDHTIPAPVMIADYITPITKIHSSFAEAKKFFDEFGGVSLFGDERKLSTEDLSQGKRNLIVGEPGIGKSLLLERIKEFLKAQGVKTILLNLRQEDSIDRVRKFVASELEGSRTILLDGVDEVKGSLLPLIIQDLEQISAENPDLPIFLAGRWVFISRYAASFRNYRYITISPFTQSQVREYLLTKGFGKTDIEDLISHVMSFGHRILTIQIPRYLSYLAQFLEGQKITAASQVSRNDLFEYFIYSKLDFEDKKLGTEKQVLIKRVLEKLALSMEIYQTNVITQDELMTFFDDLRSDLKLVALAQLKIEEFYDYSLLKVSQEHPDKIEFDNTEFQEYLAAKEITRFPDPNRTAFAFAADRTVNEIYPTWCNALTFLTDMQPQLLEQLVEFSGVRAEKFKVLDEWFLAFLSRIDPRVVPAELGSTLFRDVIEYHGRTLQWMPGQLARSLPGFYDPSIEPYLQRVVSKAEAKTRWKRLVPLGNISYVVAYLLRSNASLDRAYWRAKLLEFVRDSNDNGVLQSNALVGLQFLGDPSVIDELPNLMEGDELIAQTGLSVCTELAPDHPRSVEFFLEAVSRDKIEGRYGLLAIKEPASIKRVLKTFVADEEFRRKFMDDVSIFGDRDQVFLNHIEAAFDREIGELCKSVLFTALHYDVAHNAERSVFIRGLWILLQKHDRTFLADMVKRITDSPERQAKLFHAQSIIASTLEREHVEEYCAAMERVGEKASAYGVMWRIRESERKCGGEIYEAGRTLLEEEYKSSERVEAATPPAPGETQQARQIHELRTLLEPEPGKYSPNVFKYYNDHAKVIDPALIRSDRARLGHLLTEEVFKRTDPGKHELTIDSENGGRKTFTATSSVFIFGEAILTAQRLGLDITPYRQKLLDYIPFAFSESLRAIFELIKDIKPGELGSIIDIYKSRKSDLWRHNPGSFVSAVEQYHVVEAAPVIRELILASGWDSHVREEALRVVESVAPDADYLRKVFGRYKRSREGGKVTLTRIANGLLITKYGDDAAVKWRLRQVVDRAAAFVRPRGSRGGRKIDELEHELSFGKEFAQPLMGLEDSGYEEEYLKLLDEAMSIWAKGKEYHEYAGYLWGIVYAYFDNLKKGRSYAPLRRLEERIGTLKNRDGSNWLAGRMARLRSSYLTYLGKPENISRAVALYNEMRDYDKKSVRNSDDLLRHVQEAFDVDLRRWIESEGAYEVLARKIAQSGRQEYEKLIQKTVKSQIENVLLKRGLQVDVLREPQLLDEKRTDLLLRYGFVGPLVLEVKLTSNRDMQGAKIERSPSYLSMKKYMQGYGATHGILMVIDNAGAKNLARVAEAYQKIKGVSVMVFNCFMMSSSKPRSRKTAKRKKGGSPRSSRKKRKATAGVRRKLSNRLLKKSHFR